MDYVLKTNNLTKKYGDDLAVDNLNISVEPGEIYGFLGKNGAGKTTTIRMIMGLIQPTSGSVNLFGEQVTNQNRHHFFERIGSIIEFPGFYPNLTGIENLEIHRKLMGMENENCIEETLKIVRLSNIGKKRVKDFSLGMKQRLGIARALLHHPELLILDEPTNGLDPVGIKEVRQLILDLAQKRNITILISSHILPEVQQLASKVGIIHHGKLLEEIDFQSLEKKNEHYIKFKVNDTRKAAFLLEQEFGIEDYLIVEDGVIRVFENLDQSGHINQLLVDNGIVVSEINLTKETLEDYFVKLTRGGDNG